jgi:selenide, water dikinase
MKEDLQEIKLTEFSKGSGCGCKIAPAELEAILGSQQKLSFPGLLVGNETRDDAAVFRLEDGTCIISTTDFFTPIVNDAYDFGAIAATNAISDVYAMGGEPLMALGILGWPVNTLPAEVAAMVMQGAKDKCIEAGIPLAGGHSIDSTQPFFGLSVNGIVPEHIIKKNGAGEEGDLLFLTKPLGLGIYATAHKRGLLSEDDYQLMAGQMKQLNKAGSVFARTKGVHALTDVTGFGLLGHLIEMTEASGLSAEIERSSLPLLPRVNGFMNAFVYPDNTTRNWKAYSHKVSGVEDLSFIILSDPQTSGGLLVSVAPRYLAKYVEAARNAGIAEELLKPIGLLTAKKDKEIRVV